MKNIRCKLFGCDFKVSRNVTHHVKEYTCCTCNKQYTTNTKGNLRLLTPKLKEINDALEAYYLRKHKIRLKTTNPNKELLLFSH